MREFMLVLIDNPADFAHLSPEEMEGIVQRYTAWKDRMVEEGRLVDGRKLKDEGGKILRREAGRTVVVDGPYIEAKEVFGGYFVVLAEDWDDAMRIAADCPHAEYGVTHVKEIDRF